MNMSKNNQIIIIHKNTDEKYCKNNLSHLNDEFWRELRSKGNKIISFKDNKPKDST